MSKPLAGKVALVTGGSRGIGAATAKALAADGANVAISYSSSEEKAQSVVAKLNAAGVQAAAYKADIASPTDVETLIANVVTDFGRLDILFNNAGVFAIGPVDDPNRDVEAFTHQFDVNVRGASSAVRAAARVMKDGGRIITTGSIAGAAIGFAGMGDYSATKAAVAGLTRVWARELGPRGITVNVIQPGPIETDMTNGDPEFLKSLIPMIPVGRYGQPEDVAALVTFLASPSAGFINGAAIDIDGGLRA